MVDHHDRDDEVHRVPGWVKLSGAAALIALLLLLVLHLLRGSGGHGPMRHLSVADPEDAADFRYAPHGTVNPGG